MQQMMNLQHIRYLVSFVVFISTGLGLVSLAEQPQWPVKGIVSSNFGWRQDPLGQGKRFHAGLDIVAPAGTPIVASERGIVAFSGAYGGYGNLIALAHGNGRYTLYGHASALNVRLDQIVEQGQTIALVGSTGRSTGPHLHFEMHQCGQYKNPIEYLANKGLLQLTNKPNPVKQSTQADTPMLKMVLKPNLSHHSRSAYNPYTSPTTAFESLE